MIQFNLFNKKDSSDRSGSMVTSTNAPHGLIATPIVECTSPEVPDLDYHNILVIVESIKYDPRQGPAEAMNAIRYRLEYGDAVSIYYTLSVLDCFYKNCGPPFVNQVIANLDFIQYEFIHRQSLAVENRGQVLELIAEWGTADDAPPKIKFFFEKLWKEGYKFNPASLTKLTPEDIARMRKTVSTQGLSTKINFSKKYIAYPSDLAVPTSVQSNSELNQYSVLVAKKKEETQPALVSSTTSRKSVTESGNSSGKTFKFAPKNHYDPRSLPKFSGEFKWKKSSRVVDKEGFALLSDDEEEA
ncbi:UNVERIFIED_CONTAM: hypothetical protein HDU68_012704 [Siphonaria sp. JEL0065]|nr:hypothetical protein HDU68_012704 [Siphonaria sp. JEL0065]